MEQWKQKCTGPTSCEKIEEVRPDGCKGCKFKGKVSYPTQLGIQYQEVQIAPDALDTAAYEVELPKPFKRTNKGIKVSIDDADIDVCPFDIYPVGYGRDESLGYEVVRYHWNRQIRASFFSTRNKRSTSNICCAPTWTNCGSREP
jgi:hypothetical protein